MNTKTTTVCTTFLFVLFLQSLSFTNADEALITRLCTGTPNPGSCTSCLKSDPSSATADEAGLALISLGCVAKDLDSLIGTTTGFQQGAAPGVKDALSCCLFLFKGAKDKVTAATDKVKSKDFVTARGLVSDEVVPQVGSCLLCAQLKVPDVINNAMNTVITDGKNVMGILDSVKKGF